METHQSEYGRIKSVFVKKPTEAFLNENFIQNQWELLNYLAAPDLGQAEMEFVEFSNLLRSFKAKIQYFPYDEKVGMDSIYCRDATIATDAGVILCHMGKVARQTEPYAAKLHYEAQNIPILGQIRPPGTLEGGDVAWLDPKTLAVGHGYRSNAEGFRQLKEMLNPLGIEFIHVPLPHYKGPNDVFHLMSFLSPVDKLKAVVYSPLMPVFFRNELMARGFQLIEVPDEEFESMGCNVLAIAPSVCLMVKGNPKTKAALEKAGCTVLEYTGQEISIKGGGGPTCLTRPMLREVPDF